MFCTTLFWQTLFWQRRDALHWLGSRKSRDVSDLNFKWFYSQHRLLVSHWTRTLVGWVESLSTPPPPQTNFHTFCCTKSPDFLKAQPCGSHIVTGYLVHLNLGPGNVTGPPSLFLEFSLILPALNLFSHFAVHTHLLVTYILFLVEITLLSIKYVPSSAPTKLFLSICLINSKNFSSAFCLFLCKIADIILWCTPSTDTVLTSNDSNECSGEAWGALL